MAKPKIPVEDNENEFLKISKEAEEDYLKATSLGKEFDETRKELFGGKTQSQFFMASQTSLKKNQNTTEEEFSSLLKDSEDDSTDSLKKKLNTPSSTESMQLTETSWGKLSFFLVATVCLFFLIIGSGIYLKRVDSSLMSQLTGVYSHQFEFATPLKGKYIRNNFNRHPLFVVNGEIRNLFSSTEDISAIRLKSLSFDENQTFLESVVVYAGVILSDEELRTLSVNEIKTRYKLAQGSDGANSKLQEGELIPFQAVFFQSGLSLKQELTTVQIISYEQTGKLVLIHASKKPKG